MKFGDIGTHQPLLPHNIYSPTGEVKTEPKNILSASTPAPPQKGAGMQQKQKMLSRTLLHRRTMLIFLSPPCGGMRCSLSGCGTERDFIASDISVMPRDLLSHGYDFRLSAGWSLMEPMPAKIKCRESELMRFGEMRLNMMDNAWI